MNVDTKERIANMITLIMSIPYSVYRELKNLFSERGFHFIWDDPDKLLVNEDEFNMVEPYLYEYGVGYWMGEE